jgi:hypothetical protein
LLKSKQIVFKDLSLKNEKKHYSLNNESIAGARKPRICQNINRRNKRITVKIAKRVKEKALPDDP